LLDSLAEEAEDADWGNSYCIEDEEVFQTIKKEVEQRIEAVWCSSGKQVEPSLKLQIEEILSNSSLF